VSVANANGPALERSARPVFFQTAGSATSFATRCAQHESPTGMARQLEFVPCAFQAKEGGRVFFVESAAPSDDYAVRELSPAEVTRREQRGIRGAIERCLEKAKAHDAAAAIGGRAVRALHERYARDERGTARELELRLLVSGVRPAATLGDDTEPTFSAERDARSL
jgi:hypothetical protein